MADINQIISLGIGTPADVPHFILFGLNPNASPPAPVGGTGGGTRYSRRFRSGFTYSFLIGVMLWLG